MANVSQPNGNVMDRMTVMIIQMRLCVMEVLTTYETIPYVMTDTRSIQTYTVWTFQWAIPDIM